jgi:UMF1 family MFS transporter
MLRQVSTTESTGRISGFGLAMGFLGSVVLLLTVYIGFISGDGDMHGLFGLPDADGQNVRAAVLLAAAWFAVFAVFVAVPVPDPDDPDERGESVGFLGAYRTLWSEIVGEWRRDRNVVYYLGASAVFRDGLTGVATFGAVLGVKVYGISAADVLLFGVGASVIAAVGAVLGGLLDDRVGSKPVIVGSLFAMVVVAVTLMTLSGAAAFWVCGLLLCMFIGPILASARTLMLRMSAEGKEGVAFGLFTTTGRAASFLAPWLFSAFIDVFGTDRAGMGGLCVVLALGLAGCWPCGHQRAEILLQCHARSCQHSRAQVSLSQKLLRSSNSGGN